MTDSRKGYVPTWVRVDHDKGAILNLGRNYCHRQRQADVAPSKESAAETGLTRLK